jgi:hypothetical protein
MHWRGAIDDDGQWSLAAALDVAAGRALLGETMRPGAFAAFTSRRHQMFLRLASSIMRTTLDIDDPILKEVKAIHAREGRSIGAIVSELLAEALARRRRSRAGPSFHWTSRPMKSLVDLADKETVYAALDADAP